MPWSFFISYAREDSQLVSELADHLKARGAAVRIDVEELRSGDDILSKLSAAVLEADFFVPVISDAWHKSNWCPHELGVAMATQLRRDGQVRVLPWRLADAEIPTSMRGTHCPTIDPAQLASVAGAIVDDADGHRGGGIDRPVTSEVARRFMEATLALDGPPPSPARVAVGTGSSPSQMEFMKARDAMRAAVEEDDRLALARLRHRAPGEYLLGKLGDKSRDRLIRAIDQGVPVEALAVIARWWQLESYLRLLVYIQLRALLGPDWESPLQLPASAAGDLDMSYMAGADDSYPLARVDAVRLFQLIDEHWEQCSHGIGLRKVVWQGRIAELQPIRDRMAQCRRPHSDDVERIEQLLRDLEPAANRAIRSYLRWREPRSDLLDPVVEDWIGRRHLMAKTLVDHGARNKGIDFTLYAAQLPWAEGGPAITGTPGHFWVMQVALDIADRRHIYIDDYWSHPTVQTLLPMAGHIIQSGTGLLAVTVPAVGDPAAISDAIGGFFEAVFYASTVGGGRGARHPWRRGSPEMDPLADADGLLAVISGLNDDNAISIFSA